MLFTVFGILLSFVHQNELSTVLYNEYNKESDLTNTQCISKYNFVPVKKYEE
jgi:hypothetical protein